MTKKNAHKNAHKNTHEFELMDSDEGQDFEMENFDFEYTHQTVHFMETAREIKKQRASLRVRIKSRAQNEENAAANDAAKRAYARIEQLMEKAFEQGFIRGLKYASEWQSPVPRISFDEN